MNDEFLVTHLQLEGAEVLTDLLSGLAEQIDVELSLCKSNSVSTLSVIS